MDAVTRELILAVAISLITLAYVLLSFVPPHLKIPAENPLLKQMGDFLPPIHFQIESEALSGTWYASTLSLEEGLKRNLPYTTAFTGNWIEIPVPLNSYNLPSTAL